MSKSNSRQKVEYFDDAMKGAIERSLGVPFDSLDSGLFTMSIMPRTTVIFYGDIAVAIIVNRKIYDCKQNKGDRKDL